MRKSEENNKFRKKENAKKQYGSKSERPEKHICPPGECDLAKKCGGCQYQGMDYEKQLNKKQREVKELLEKWSRLSGCRSHFIIGTRSMLRFSG